MRHETAYTYQADVWCEECADEIMADIRKDNPDLVPEDVMDLESFDSAAWPKPFLTDSSESDSPDNCAGCQAFLHNALTSEGYAYLKSMLDEHGAKPPAHAREWADWYGFSYHDECAVCGYEADECECEHPEVTREWRSYEMA